MGSDFPTNQWLLEDVHWLWEDLGSLVVTMHGAIDFIPYLAAHELDDSSTSVGLSWSGVCAHLSPKSPSKEPSNDATEIENPIESL